jgi:sulfite reductase alpha subunit-like flavoprotein
MPARTVYASQTGNARRTAEKLSAELEAAGIAVRLFNASVYPLRQLKSERLLYLVVSTQGDGDPPDDGRAFVEHLLGPRAPKLPNLRYGVLGLGDSSYPQFNAIGRTLDGRLEQLGAERAIALGEADLDIDSVATPWRQLALEPAAVSRSATRWHAALQRGAPCIPPVTQHATAAKIPLPPSCFPTSASPPATATRLCATLNCRWQAPASTTHPAMRWVSGQPTTPPWSTRSSNTCNSMAQRRSPTREKT